MNTIVLEGPDGAGKSTLAESFEDIGYSRLPFGVPDKRWRRSEESLFHFFFDPLYAYGKSQRPVVFDRLHLSDRVYAPLMRGGTKMTPRAEALLERYLDAIDGQIIICLPPRRVAYANWASRPGREYVKEKRIFHAVYDGYVKLLFDPKRNRNFLWYDYTRHRVGSFVNAVKGWRGFPLPAGVVGSQRPKFLFVGERPGPASKEVDLPFMTTENCSGWLFDAIRDAGYEESEIAFVNTIGREGKPFELTMLLSYLMSRGLKATISLGQIAEGAVARVHAALPNFTFSHPQYVKRFKAKERAAYVARLKNIRRETK